MQDRNRIGGYTLIEVLVALMVMVLSLTVLFRIFSSGLRNISEAADYTRAVLVAETQLASAGTGEALEVGRTQGKEGDRFRWTRIVSDYFPYSDGGQITLPVSAFHITVIVEWLHSGHRRRINLSSIRLGPNVSAGGNT